MPSAGDGAGGAEALRCLPLPPPRQPQDTGGFGTGRLAPGPTSATSSLGTLPTQRAGERAAFLSKLNMNRPTKSSFLPLSLPLILLSLAPSLPSLP